MHSQSTDDVVQHMTHMLMTQRGMVSNPVKQIASALDPAFVSAAFMWHQWCR